jgi:HEAT repeat protein
MTTRLMVCALALGLPTWPCDMARQTMGRNIQLSETIAIVDVIPSAPSFTATFAVQEYLKDNSASPRTTFALPRRCPTVPEGKGIAVLLRSGWQSSQWPVLEVYTAPADLADLRALVKLYALGSERARLDALRARLDDGNPRYREQLFDDLRNMREPGNYPVVTGLYPDLDKAGRLRLIDLIGYIGDTRGVPVLLRALEGNDTDLAGAARAQLTYFRGAPGAQESLDRHPAPVTPESDLQRGFRFFREGRKNEARPLLLAVAADENESPRSRIWAALDAIDQLDAAGKSGLRTTMWPLLVRLAREGDYLQIADVARILRSLPDPGNLPVLLTLLGRKEFVGQKTPYVAAMAIRELGPGVRDAALARLVEMAEAEAKEKDLRIAGEPPAPLVALAWLGGEPEFQRTKPIWGDDLHPLWGVALQRDEGAFLVQALRTPGKLPAEAVNWIVTRLGELKERRAVGALLQQLQSQSSDVVGSAQESLIRIGGSEVASAARALLDGKGPAPAREAALNILYGLNGPDSLPYLRKAIPDENLRTTALFLLGNVGTAEDLKLLAPMRDFWTGDRQWHYWFMLATAEIRERNP